MSCTVTYIGSKPIDGGMTCYHRAARRALKLSQWKVGFVDGSQ